MGFIRCWPKDEFQTHVCAPRFTRTCKAVLENTTALSLPTKSTSRVPRCCYRSGVSPTLPRGPARCACTRNVYRSHLWAPSAIRKTGRHYRLHKAHALRTRGLQKDMCTDRHPQEDSSLSGSGSHRFSPMPALPVSAVFALDALAGIIHVPIICYSQHL